MELKEAPLELSSEFAALYFCTKSVTFHSLGSIHRNFFAGLSGV